MPTSTCDKPVVAPQTQQLPPWNVILHNDNTNTAEYVVTKVQELAKLKEADAITKVLESHKKGKSLLLTTHKEKAELLVEMFTSCKITVSMEKA